MLLEKECTGRILRFSQVCRVAGVQRYIYYMLYSAQRPNLTGYPSTFVFICRNITIFKLIIPHDHLPSGLVAQLVEQR